MCRAEGGGPVPALRPGAEGQRAGEGPDDVTKLRPPGGSRAGHPGRWLLTQADHPGPAEPGAAGGAAAVAEGCRYSPPLPYPTGEASPPAATSLTSYYLPVIPKERSRFKEYRRLLRQLPPDSRATLNVMFGHLYM